MLINKKLKMLDSVQQYQLYMNYNQRLISLVFQQAKGDTEVEENKGRGDSFHLALSEIQCLG